MEELRQSCIHGQVYGLGSWSLPHALNGDFSDMETTGFDFENDGVIGRRRFRERPNELASDPRLPSPEAKGWHTQAHAADLYEKMIPVEREHGLLAYPQNTDSRKGCDCLREFLRIDFKDRRCLG